MSEENNCNGQCSGCSSASTCGQKNDPSSMLVPPHKLSNIKHVIGIVSGKGGVGKSMVTGLMATSFRRKNLNVGILDADITGPSIPKMFGVEGHELSGDADGAYPAVSKNNIHMVSINLLVENPEDPVVWRGPVIGGVVKQFWQDIIWKDIDYMFIVRKSIKINIDCKTCSHFRKFAIFVFVDSPEYFTRTVIITHNA